MTDKLQAGASHVKVVDSARSYGMDKLANLLIEGFQVGDKVWAHKGKRHYQGVVIDTDPTMGYLVRYHWNDPNHLGKGTSLGIFKEGELTPVTGGVHESLHDVESQLHSGGVHEDQRLDQLVSQLLEDSDVSFSPGDAVHVVLSGDGLSVSMDGLVVEPPKEKVDQPFGREHQSMAQRGVEVLAVQVDLKSIQFSGDFEGSPFEEAIEAELESGTLVLEKNEKGWVFYSGEWSASAHVTAGS